MGHTEMWQAQDKQLHGLTCFTVRGACVVFSNGNVLLVSILNVFHLWPLVKII